MRIVVAAVFGLAMISQGFAMDGVNVDTGTTVTVDDSTVFAPNTDIDAFDGDSGDPLTFTVQSVAPADTGTEVTVINQATGDTETYDFTAPEPK